MVSIPRSAGVGDDDARAHDDVVGVGAVDAGGEDNDVVSAGDALLDCPSEFPSRRRGIFGRRRPAVFFLILKSLRMEVADSTRGHPIK